MTERFGLDDDADVEDFMTRFSDPDTYAEPEEATQRFGRYLDGGDPDVRRAASAALSQLDDEQFERAARSMNDDDRAGFAGGLLDKLGQSGLDIGSILGTLGLSSGDPRSMGPDELSKLAGYARKTAPRALRETAEEQPAFMKALGNPLVMGALGMLAARYLSKRNR